MLPAVFHPVMLLLERSIFETGFAPPKLTALISVLRGSPVCFQVLICLCLKFSRIISRQDHNLTTAVIMELLTKFPGPARPNALRKTVRPNRLATPHNARSRPLSVLSTTRSQHAAKCTTSRFRDTLRTVIIVPLDLSIPNHRVSC